MKIYKHEGKGFYIGSVVIVINNSLEDAEKVIRQILDETGLIDEALNIVECADLYNDGVIYFQNGDY